MVSAFVICVNSLVLGLSIDIYKGHVGWEIIETGFCIYYLSEFIMNLMTKGSRYFFCGADRGWNRFDVVCLIVSVIDASANWLIRFAPDGTSINTGSLPIIRMLRLARLVRLLRTLRFEFFLELKIMVMGVFAGFKVLFWAIILLLVIIYGLGVICTSAIGYKYPEFSSVAAAMFTMYRCVTDGCSAYDGTPMAERLREDYGVAFLFLYILITMLIAVGVFNLIMAIFIDNVVRSQTIRKQKEISETHLYFEVKIKKVLARLFNGADYELPMKPHFMDMRAYASLLDDYLDLDQGISRAEFTEFLLDPSFIEILDTASIDTSVEIQLFDIMDADMSENLSVDELITGLLTLRGDVTKGDIIGISMKVRHLTILVHEVLQMSRDALQRSKSEGAGGTAFLEYLRPSA